MGKNKIPKQLLDKVIQKAPEYKKVIGEGIPVLFDAVRKKLAPMGKVLKEHWPKFLAGGVGGAVVADDIHQRIKRKQEQDRHVEQEIKQAQAIRKQDAEIKALEKETERVDTLEVINEQLCDVLRESKGGDYLDEEIK